MTTSTHYTARMLSFHDTVILDTSALMDIKGITNFITENEALLIRNAVHITILGSVAQELVRHLHSHNPDKVAKASEALSLIRVYPEVFIAEAADFSDAALSRAFADKDIFLRLADQRCQKRQLLITNDRRLSKDAFALNSLESCCGQHVSVCYLNHLGELCRCSCTIPNAEDSNPEVVCSSAEQANRESIPQQKKLPRANHSQLFHIGMGSLLFTAGVLTGKYGHRLLSLIHI